MQNSMDDAKPVPQMNSPNDANNNRSPLQNSPNDANNNRSPQQNSQPISSQISPSSSENGKQSRSQASDEQPFFASNLAYYPELPQPSKAKDVNKYLSYEDWKSTACSTLAVKKTKNLQQQQQQHQQQHHQQKQLLKQQKQQVKQQQQKQQVKQQPKQQHQKQQQKQQQQKQLQKQQQKLLQKQKQKEQKKLQKPKQPRQHQVANPMGAGHELQKFDANPYSWQFLNGNEYSSTQQPGQQQMANPIGAGHEIQKFNVNMNPWQLLGDNNYSSTPPPSYGQPKQEQPKQEQMLFNDNAMIPQPFGQQKQQMNPEQLVGANYQNQNLDGNSNIWQLFGDNNYESTQPQYGQPKQQEQMTQEQMLFNDNPMIPQPFGQQKQQMTPEQLVGANYQNLDSYSNTWQILNNNRTTQQLYGQPKQQELSQEQNQQLDGNSNIWQLFGDNNLESTQQPYAQPKQLQQEQLTQEQMLEAIKSNHQKQNIDGNSNIWPALNETRTTPLTYGQQKQQMTQEQLLGANYQNLDSYSNTWQFLNNNRAAEQLYGQPKQQELTQEKMLASIRANYQNQNINGNSNIWHPLNESGYSSTKQLYGQPKQLQREQLTQPQMDESIKPSSHQGQNFGGNANILQLLGEKVYASTLQANGEPLVPLSMLAEMSGVNLACVFMTAHLIQNNQDPNEYSVLTHFKDSELRSFVVLSDEVKHVLKRYEIREHNLDNTVPNLASPMADNLPQPPTQWMPNRKVKPKPKELLQNRQTVDARGHDKFINPNLKLVSEWQPETSSYNYKLQSP